MTDTRPAIELRRVDIAYDAAPVVRGVDLEVRAHDLHVLLGESGSGKTTILRAVAGFETVSAGSIALFGDVVDRGDGRAVWPPEKRGVGVVFQDYALFPHLDVAGNVAFGMRQRAPDKVAHLLEQVGLANMGTRPVTDLSGGQQQRVALARALAQKPRIILLDEPFSNLNRELRDELRERTASLLRAEQVTAIFVTHDRHEAFAIADRISVIGAGQVLQTGTCAEIYEQPVSEAVARSVGDASFVDAEIDEAGTSAVCALGRVTLKGRAGRQARRLMLRPDQIAINAGGAGGADSGNGAAAVVERVTYFGAVDEIALVLGSGVRLLAHARPGAVTAGARVRVTVRGPVACVP